MKGLKLGKSLMKYSSGSGMHSNATPIKNFFADRHSKQHMKEKSMFGSRKGKHGSDFKIGKKFSSSSISPSVDEFDKMMSDMVGKSSSKKKSMFSKK